jgi:hypothetical protein
MITARSLIDPGKELLQRPVTYLPSLRSSQPVAADERHGAMKIHSFEACSFEAIVVPTPVSKRMDNG